MVKFNCFPSISQYKTQIFASCAANIISISHGAALGWLSPTLLILQSSQSPLDSGQITVSETSWLGSVFCFGGICGNFLLGIIANTIGRKRALCLLAFPQISFWLLVIFGYHINFLYAARVLAGLAGGGIFVGVPLFVSEIADKRIRGTLGSLLFLSVNTGLLLGFIIGANLPYDLVPKILVALPATFFVAIIIFPETPQFLLSNGKDEDAKKSLAFYKNLNLDIKENNQKFDEFFKELSDNINNTAAKTSLSFSDFISPENRKAMARGFGMVALYILSGGFAIITYTASVFEKTGANFNPNTSAIIVATVQILGTYTSIIIVDRFPRKMLLAISTCGSGLGFFITGTFSIFALKHDLSQLNWIPVVSLSFAIFTGAVGLYPLTFVVLAELLPQKIRAIASSVCNIFLNILAFGLLKTFPPLMIQLGLYGVMWIFGAVCLLGMVFVLVFLPETKGKLI